MRRTRWCVRSGGVRGVPERWCARADGKASAYADHVATLCDHVVTLPLGVEQRVPSCAECLKVIEAGARVPQ